MRSDGYTALTAILLVLVIVLTGAAGCTAPQNTDTATIAPVSAPAPATPAGVITTAASTKTADIDTRIGVNFNDFSCLDVQKEMGVEYLYPDQKYTLSAASPGSGVVNVNILFLDYNDYLALREIEPKWDSLNKRWVYNGIVPFAQFDDLTLAKQKTITIKNQGKYFICVDDRKEVGLSDMIYYIPVKLLKIA
jgi:hypothetical protein